MTHKYELMVILDPEIDERTVAPSLDKFLGVIRNAGGTVEVDSVPGEGTAIRLIWAGTAPGATSQDGQPHSAWTPALDSIPALEGA